MDESTLEYLLDRTLRRSTDVAIDPTGRYMVTPEGVADIWCTQTCDGWVASVVLLDVIWEEGLQVDRDEWDEVEIGSTPAEAREDALVELLGLVARHLTATLLADVEFLRGELRRLQSS